MATNKKTSNTKTTVKKEVVKKEITEKKEEAPVVKKNLTTGNKYYCALKKFENNGKTFFAGCNYPGSFFDDVETIKEKGFIC